MIIDSKKPNLGECWRFLTRTHEPNAFFIVRKIETLPNDGEVYHISVFGLAIKNPQQPDTPIGYIAHLPIVAEKLWKSTTEKIEQEPPAKDWEQGYNTWHEAYHSGGAGVFTETIDQCVDFIEQLVNQPNA